MLYAQAKEVEFMVSRREIILLAVCCILVSIPVSYLVNTYRMVNLIPSTDGLTSLVKYVPFLVLSTVLIYGVYEVTKLAYSSRIKEAAKLSAILIVLLAAAFTVWLFTFNLGVRYVL
jgi:hypothetical protein